MKTPLRRRPRRSVTIRSCTSSVLTSIILCVTTVAPVAAATYTVTTTNDSGAGSLRQAIIDANTPGPDTVAFNIPGAGPHVISLASSLPSLTDDETVIDGYTQPGSVPAPLGSGTTRVIRIEVRNSGIYIDNASGCTVRGLAINISPDNYVFISGFSAQSNTIEGNYLGTDASGTAGGGCIFAGVHLRDGTHHNIIGGSDPDSGNVVSAAGGHGIALYGSDYNQIRGNYVGTDCMGTVGIGNADHGITCHQPGSSYNTIGGTTAAERNVICDNTGDGIRCESPGGGASNYNTIIGNYIGVDSTGNAALGNGLSGVRFSEGTGNRLGAPGPGEEEHHLRDLQCRRGDKYGLELCPGELHRHQRRWHGCPGEHVRYPRERGFRKHDRGGEPEREEHDQRERRIRGFSQ